MGLNVHDDQKIESNLHGRNTSNDHFDWLKNFLDLSIFDQRDGVNLLRCERPLRLILGLYREQISFAQLRISVAIDAASLTSSRVAGVGPSS
ncbi:MAG: hypothetical protein RL189_363 [Pseudomonadota bacterium]